MTDAELIEVYSAANTQDAYIIKASLESVGIEAHVMGDNLQNAVGDLPAASIAPVVWVHAKNYEQARTIISEQLERRQSVSTLASRWICGECGEPNEATFDICWKCETEHGSIADS